MTEAPVAKIVFVVLSTMDEAGGLIPRTALTMFAMQAMPDTPVNRIEDALVAHGYITIDGDLLRLTVKGAELAKKMHKAISPQFQNNPDFS